ncbi:MAG TPA: hypothetical protein IAC99_03255 [Candidatus Choladocola avistercoris]|nr:hypothetical protein [Candidatus Choladocola avistercoris]
MQQYFVEYLGTDTVRTIISEWMASVFPDTDAIVITPEQLEQLTSDLAAVIRPTPYPTDFLTRPKWVNISQII